MKTRFRLENIDDVEATITITMTVKQWVQLQKQLATPTWPACDLSIAISDVVLQAKSVFFPKLEGE